MGEVVYRSEITVERARGALRYATLPAEEAPVAFGVHGAVAEHYKAQPGSYEPHATTLDYVVAAAAGWLTGTLGGALEARGIPAGDGRLRSTAVGEIELDGRTLVIKRIHVQYHLRVQPGHDAEAVDRVMAVHADHCPVARSIAGSITITTGIDVEESEPQAP